MSATDTEEGIEIRALKAMKNVLENGSRCQEYGIESFWATLKRGTTARSTTFHRSTCIGT